MSPDDKRWTWLVYATVFVPLIGQPLVAFASSILYPPANRGRGLVRKDTRPIRVSFAVRYPEGMIVGTT